MIELIVVLGILSAVAIPWLIGMSADAEKAAITGVADATSAADSAMTVNYAAGSIPANFAAAALATAVVATAKQGGLPTGYASSASAAGVEPTTIGAGAVCTVSTRSGTTTDRANFLEPQPMVYPWPCVNMASR